MILAELDTVAIWWVKHEAVPGTILKKIRLHFRTELIATQSGLCSVELVHSYCQVIVVWISSKMYLCYEKLKRIYRTDRNGALLGKLVVA